MNSSIAFLWWMIAGFFCLLLYPYIKIVLNWIKDRRAYKEKILADALKREKSDYCTARVGEYADAVNKENLRLQRRIDDCEAARARHDLRLRGNLTILTRENEKLKKILNDNGIDYE